MEAEIVRLWASPSTMHFRIIVWNDAKTWFRSCEVHMGLDQLPLSARWSLLYALEDDLKDSDPGDVDVPLF